MEVIEGLLSFKNILLWCYYIDFQPWLKMSSSEWKCAVRKPQLIKIIISRLMTRRLCSWKIVFMIDMSKHFLSSQMLSNKDNTHEHTFVAARDMKGYNWYLGVQTPTIFSVYKRNKIETFWECCGFIFSRMVFISRLLDREDSHAKTIRTPNTLHFIIVQALATWLANLM